MLRRLWVEPGSHQGVKAFPHGDFCGMFFQGSLLSFLQSLGLSDTESTTFAHSSCAPGAMSALVILD